MFKKRILNKKLFLIVGFILCLSAPPCQAYAQATPSNGIIIPYNTNIKYSTISLSFSGQYAYCSASVTGYSSNTSSTALTMTLYKKNSQNGWSQVTSWSSSSNTYRCDLSKSVKVGSGSYKLVVKYTAGPETIQKEQFGSN